MGPPIQPARIGETLTYTGIPASKQHKSFPNFANGTNISGNAGITGNNQDPANFGPPTLNFSTVNGLSDGQSSHNRTETQKIGDNVLWTHRNHNLQIGGDINRREMNFNFQQDPRGTFTFNGNATQQMVGGKGQLNTGSDFADFLLGIPDSSSIAFGNADKYFRQTVYDAYIDDDWRVTHQLRRSRR